jgi:hypothetical protein
MRPHSLSSGLATMTSVSRSDGPGLPLPARNSAQSFGFGRAARNVLALCIMAASVCGSLGLAVLPAGCVVPVPLELDQPDAAPNAPPIILSVKDMSLNEVLSPGPLQLHTVDETGQFFFTLSDNDSGDQLEVHLYADYNRVDTTGLVHQNNFLSVCLAPPGDVRTTICGLSNICAGLAGNGFTNPHFLEAVVSDRPIDFDASPPFRAIPAPGLSTSRAWFLDCI